MSIVERELKQYSGTVMDFSLSHAVLVHFETVKATPIVDSHGLRHIILVVEQVDDHRDVLGFLPEV